MLALALVLAACQPEQPNTDDDPWHCGELGLTCVGPLGIGDCMDGECQGRLTLGCYPPNQTCEEICKDLEATCAARGCEGATAWVWTASTQEEADALCVSADRPTAEALTIACDEELPQSALSINCCCKW